MQLKRIGKDVVIALVFKDKIKYNKNVSNTRSGFRRPNANKCVTAVSENQYCLHSARNRYCSMIANILSYCYRVDVDFNEYRDII